MGARKRRDQRKQREQYLQVTTKGAVDSISISVGPDGSIRFGTDVINAHVVTSYERPTKPKVVNHISIAPDRLYLGTNEALRTNFDHLFAVDTNTRAINGARVSVTAVVEAQRLNGEYSYIEPILFFEFMEVASNPEPLGWAAAADNIVYSSKYRSFPRIALVVDSEFQSIPAYNARSLALYRGRFLPERLTLVYATSDTGPEYFPNAAIRYANKAADMFLGLLESGRIPMNGDTLSGNYGYTGFRSAAVQPIGDAPLAEDRGPVVNLRQEYRIVVRAQRDDGGASG